MRNIVLNLTILSVAVLAGLFAVEYGIRFMLPQYDPSGHVGFTINQDSVVLAKNRGTLRQIKNTGDYNVEVKINNLGLRDTKNLMSAKTADIFVVGDSFSFGWGVEENQRFSNILDTRLPKRGVFNKKHGAKAKRLIVGVTIENDLRLYNQTVPSKTKVISKNKKTNSNQFGGSIQSLKYYLRDHSAAYFLITAQFHSISSLQNLLIKIGLITPNIKSVLSNKISPKIIESSATRLIKLVKNYDAYILIIPSRAL